MKRIDKLEGNQTHNNSTMEAVHTIESSSSNSGSLSESLLKGNKLEIPKLLGQNVLGWLFKVEQFFDFHEIKEQQRISIA